MKTTTFSLASLTNLTDSDLSRLLIECQRENDRRAERRAAERQRWINVYCHAFLYHSNATATLVGDTTVVAVYDRDTGMHIGTAKPVHGDVFNREVGLAVAYAKSIGIQVPDCI